MAIPELNLLPLATRCAVLQRFDRELLSTLFGCDDQTIDAFLATTDLEVLQSGYCIPATTATTHIRQLTTEQPQALFLIHQQAFLYYLQSLRARLTPQETMLDEDQCLFHLDALFVPLLTRMQWQTMRRYALQTLRVRPMLREHRQRLWLFVGYAATHLRKYRRAEHVLATLLDQTDLASDLRLKAIKALADGCWFRSRYDEALLHYEQLYQVACAAEHQTYQGIALLNRASVFHELERYDQALSDCERSLTLFRILGDQIREAHALYHAALFSLHLGRWDAARRFASEATSQFERLGMHFYLGFIYWCHGLLAHIFGDEPASETAYLRGLAIAETPETEHLSLALDIRVNLGILAYTQGNYHQALKHYDQALSYAFKLERQHQVCLIQLRRGQTIERLGHYGRAFLIYRSAINTVEQMGSAMAQEDIKISLLGTIQQLYEAIVLRCLAWYEQTQRSDWLARAFHYVERARSRAFLDSLAQKATTDHNPTIETVLPATLAEIQAHLPADALLIEYYTTGVLPRGEQLIARIPNENQRLRATLAITPRLIGFVISNNQCHLLAPSIDPNRLRPAIGDRYPGRHLLLGHLPTTLYDQLIQPAQESLVGKRVLYLIPHGPLHYLPFAALRTPSGAALLDLQPDPNSDRIALAQAPSATILVRNCLPAPPTQATQALAIGFNEPNGSQPLRFAEAEAVHVAELFHGQALYGPQVKREYLHKQHIQLRYLHIAGHARFTPHDPLGSWLLLGEEDQLTARQIIETINVTADLVTLSSCTSGISHVVPGDELLGLPRAFLYAGIPTVICTRWEAIDIVTLLLMDRFYRELRQHSPGIALRNAQVAIRDMTHDQLREILTTWQNQSGMLAEALDDPQDLLNDLDATLFSAPMLWAPFMLIGRA